MSDWIRHAIAASIGIGVGFIFCRLGALDFDPTLDLGDLVQAITVLLIFFIANQFYQELHDQRRKQIEVLTDLAGDTLAEVDKVYAAFAACRTNDVIEEPRRFQLDKRLRFYSNSVHTLERGLEQCRANPDEFAQIKKDRETYKDLLTEDPYPSRFSEEAIRRGEKEYHQIRTHLRLFQLRLSQGVELSR